MQKTIAILLENLYQFDSVRAIKDKIRPIKHHLLGKSGIYRWVDEICRAENGNNIHTVLDIGASVGDTALLFLRNFKQATVYAFEPLAVSRNRLINRTRAYRHRINIYEHGFYNQICSMPINITSYHDASSLLPIRGIGNNRIHEIATTSIDLSTVDHFCEQQRIHKIDLCKIDVEGVELEVLEGGKASFLHHVSNLIIEINSLRKGHLSDSHIKVFQLLHDCGFTFIGCDTDYFFTKDPRVLNLYL